MVYNYFSIALPKTLDLEVAMANLKQLDPEINIRAEYDDPDFPDKFFLDGPTRLSKRRVAKFCLTYGGDFMNYQENSHIIWGHWGEGFFYEALDRVALTREAAKGYYRSSSLTYFDSKTKYAFYCSIGEINRWRAMGTLPKLKQAFDLAVKLPPDKVAAVMDAADPLGDDLFIDSLKSAEDA
jgi:hypothetical protein